jgi:hypothetical protein
MRKSLLPPAWHTYIYIFALILLVVGMPLSKFLMSLSQIILAANWLLEGNQREKWRSFFRNKPALLVSSLLLMHILGLLWTSDFSYAFKDIRIKAPLLVLPLILSTSKPLPQKTIDLILYFFIASILAGTIIGMFVLTGVIHRELVDIRNVSIFISHIRFALLIDIAIFIGGYFAFHSTKKSSRIFWPAIILWLLIFLVITESITGLGALGLAALLVMLYLILRSPKRVMKIAGFAVIVCIGAFAWYAGSLLMKPEPATEQVDFSKLDYLTPRGKIYYSDSSSRLAENGHLIWVYVSNEELEEAWNKRSKIMLSDEDLKGNPLKFTLVRFLASKGLRKDLDGVNALSDAEVKAIERGVVNVNYQEMSSLEGRLHEISWELDLYRKTGDPNGHSLTMRFEFWKTAIGIIKEHPLIGVGTGDIAKAFEEQYEKTNSPLTKEWRLRSHNQYLSIGVAFGIIGLVWFIITLVGPLVLGGKAFDFLYITFFIIAVVSFLTEDTLETQAGVTFFAFFNPFFLFCIPREKDVS